MHGAASVPPNPEKGESLASFVGRYVSSPHAEKTFPDKKQRLAVSYSKYREAKKKRA
jgi:hypothetical protein